MKPAEPAPSVHKRESAVCQPPLTRAEPAAIAGPEAIEGIHSIELTKLGQEAKSNRHNHKGISKGRKSSRKTKAEVIKDTQLF